MTTRDAPDKAARPRKRTYDNSGRRQQARETREAILQALVGQLVANRRPDFSIEAAAADAGVTRRTFFRHFPNRASILNGLADYVLGITGEVALPKNPEQYLATVENSYRLFASHSELIQALLLSETGRGVRSGLRERRREGNAAALQPALEGLPAAERHAITAVLCHLMTAETWWQLESVFQLRATDAAATITWMMEVVLAAIARGEHPALDRGQAGPSERRKRS